METPGFLLFLDPKLYLIGIRELDSPKNKGKYTKANDALNTTEAHKQEARKAKYCCSSPHLNDPLMCLFWHQTHYFIDLCLIKKLTFMQINVMMCMERGFQTKNMEGELGLKQDGVKYHLRKIRKKLNLKHTDDVRFAILGLKKGEMFFKEEVLNGLKNYTIFPHLNPKNCKK